MTRTSLALALLLLGVGCSSEEKPAPKPSERPVKSGQPSGHGNGIDRASAPQLAMLEAPDGATPCETAYLAIEAEQKAAAAAGTASLFKWVAARADFLATCAALPAESQACLAPRHQVRNRDACQLAKPPSDQLARLFVPATLPPRPPIAE